jgi:DNA modification methylase
MKPYYQEPNQTLYCGHALDILKAMLSESIDCVMTSPPYWGLRTYKTELQIWGDNHCEHEWGPGITTINSGGGYARGNVKEYPNQPGGNHRDWGLGKVSQGNFCLKCNAWRGELGLEPTIELYIGHLLQIFDEVKRVLKKTGTCWVNIGDSYASGKGTCFNPGGGKGSFSSHGDRKDSGVYPLDRGNISALKAEGLLPKSLCGIPERFSLSMLGRGWIKRNTIIWQKNNPMPESVKDRFTEDFEYIYFFVKSKRYWFEQQFEVYTEPLNRWGGDFTKPTDYTKDNDGLFAVQEREGREGRNRRPNELGRNKRCVWNINTVPYPGAHFATFPEKLCKIPILAGCPDAICLKCGEARKKVYKSGFTAHDGDTRTSYPEGSTAKRLALLRQASRERGAEYANDMELIGYTDCGCDAKFEPGTVLDPFCGSGTVLAMAKKLGRKAIGIDILPEYCAQTVGRLQKIPLSLKAE